MAETRNVGTASGSLAANTSALMTAMVNLTQATTVVLGANAKFEVAWFRSNVTNYPLTIISADKNNPAIMTEGFGLCGSDGEGFFGNRSGGFASQVHNVTFDGIHFIPRKMTQVQLAGGGHYTIQDAPGGTSWRIDPTFAGFNSSGKKGGYGAGAAYMIALNGGQGAQNITVQNCFFDGYGRGVQLHNINGLLFHFNTWTRWSEDMFRFSAGNNIVIEYNLFDQGRAISSRDSFLGWQYGQSANQAPPHTDCCQTYGGTSNFIFQYNVMIDHDRSHFFLHKNRNNVGVVHTGTVIQNNYAEQYDSTNIWVSNCQSPRVERNKCIKAGGSETPTFRVYNDGTNPGARINYNYAPNEFVTGEANWASNVGNVTTNAATLPPGWVEIRKAFVANGVDFAGQYGSSGGVSNSAPSFSTDPALSPATQVQAGNVLTAIPASASGNPNPTITHRWFRNGVLMAAQTDLSYPTVDPTDVNAVFTYITRAANGVGPAFVDSNVSNSVTCVAPAGGTAPVFSTTPQLNPANVVAGVDTITAAPAQVSGTAPITIAHRWFRNTVLIATQTDLTYPTLSTDAGASITYRTRASNSVQSNVDSNLSNAIVVLAAGPPAGLVAGEVAFEALVQDPAFPDARRTFTIRVPSTSLAFNADAMFWDSAADTQIRPMTQLTNQGGDNIWRAISPTPAGTAHLRSPNASFTTVHLYYRLTPTSIQSDPSTYTFSQTVPDVGNPDPVLVDTVFVDETMRVAVVQGDARKMVTKEFGVVWQLPF